MPTTGRAATDVARDILARRLRLEIDIELRSFCVLRNSSTVGVVRRSLHLG
jgi:hypothetical protein